MHHIDPLSLGSRREFLRRVGMGLGGAMVWPAVLGMTYAALPTSRAALAGAMILGVAGIGGGLAPHEIGDVPQFRVRRAVESQREQSTQAAPHPRP